MSTIERFYAWLDQHDLKVLITRYPKAASNWSAWLSSDTGAMVEGVVGYGSSAAAAIEHLIPQLSQPLKTSTVKRTETNIPRFEAANA